ncbi:MAG: hypothetical protein Kow0076_7470 [Francisella sp.]
MASFLLGRHSSFKNSSFQKVETKTTNTTTKKQTELEILEKSKESQTPENSINCRPPVNAKINNYVIGYGSLMNKDSRKITVPKANYAFPIIVKGFERLWASRGEKSKATFLLAVPNTGYLMNAIYYKADASDISATDLREATYCRVKVPTKDITPLGIKSLPQGDF